MDTYKRTSCVILQGLPEPDSPRAWFSVQSYVNSSAFGDRRLPGRWHGYAFVEVDVFEIQSLLWRGLGWMVASSQSEVSARM